MMQQNYNNEAKCRSVWFALVLLMITALPITAQNAGDSFYVDNSYWYEVVDATAKTEKETYANTTPAKQFVLLTEDNQIAGMYIIKGKKTLKTK